VGHADSYTHKHARHDHLVNPLFQLEEGEKATKINEEEIKEE
jgi:hypothetical protein